MTLKIKRKTTHPYCHLFYYYSGGRNQNDIQKSRLRWFGHVMQMGEERIHKKMLNTKIEGK
jgi:hypothetical protein